MTDEFIKPTQSIGSTAIREMIQLAPDLFCASEQFLLVEPVLGEILKTRPWAFLG